MPDGHIVKHKLPFVFLWGLMADPGGFGTRVLQARLALGARRGKPMTQTELAEKLGVTQGTVGRWEKALKEPDLETISQIAKALEVDPRWLAFGGDVNHQRGTEAPWTPPTGLPGAQPMTVAEAKERDEETKKAERKPGRRKTG